MRNATSKVLNKLEYTRIHSFAIVDNYQLFFYERILMKTQTSSKILCLALLSSAFVFQTPAFAQKPDAVSSPAVVATMQHISADSMRGNLQFLASDLLEGRGTPSRGLDLAAEFIAAQFQIAGLEPAGDKGYFQTANWNSCSTDFSNLHRFFGNKTSNWRPFPTIPD